MKKYVDKIPKAWYNVITTDPNTEKRRFKMNRYYDINENRKSNCTYIGTIDRFETENDGCVTVRDRDTMQQVRIPMAEVKSYISEKLKF